MYPGAVAVTAGTLRTTLVTRAASGVRWLSGNVLIALGLRLFLLGP